MYVVTEVMEQFVSSINLEKGSDKIILNIGNHLRDNMADHSRNFHSPKNIRSHIYNLFP